MPDDTRDDVLSTTAIGDDPVYSASSLIEEYAYFYRDEIYRNHFPSEIDGLKAVFRRYIYALHLARLVNSNLMTSRAVAELMAAHPYNDTSMYEIIMRMSQPWVYNPPLGKALSNIGTYSGNDPAAPRYTKTALTDYTREVFLDGIDVHAIPKTEGDSLALEPRFFVPAIPTALTFDNLTIGYGKGCLTASLALGNVCDLVELYAEHQKVDKIKLFPTEKYPELFLPDFPTPCLISNWRELLESYRNKDYDAPIEMCGHVTITRDRIVVQSLPHGIPFLTAEATLKEYLIGAKTKNSPLARSIKNVNAPRSKMMIGNLHIVPRQGTHPLTLWKQIAPLIRFTGRYHPKPNYRIPSRDIAHFSYPMILRRWYKERSQLVSSTKRRRLQALTRQKWIAEAHLVVVYHTDRCIEIIRNMSSEAEALEAFKAEFGLTPFQGRELLNQNLRVLARISEVKLKDRIATLTRQLQELNDSFRSIGDDIVSTAKTIKKKYDKGRVCGLPNYIGYVAFAEGNVCFETGEEVSDILEQFPRDALTIHRVEGNWSCLVNEQGRPVKGNVHKYFYGDLYGFSGNPLTDYYTISLRDGAACYSNRVEFSRRGGKLYYTTEQITCLSRSGKISYGSVTQFSRRKSVLNTRGARTDLIHVHSRTSEPYFIATLNPGEPNLLTIERITPDQSSYVISPVGDPILYYSETGRDWFIAPPSDTLSRCNIRAIDIPDASTLVSADRPFLRYDLNGKARRLSGIRLHA